MKITVFAPKAPGAPLEELVQRLFPGPTTIETRVDPKLTELTFEVFSAHRVIVSIPPPFVIDTVITHLEMNETIVFIEYANTPSKEVVTTT